MARRIDVTGAGGVRLAAWEFADPPKTDPAVADRPAPQPGAPGVLLLHGLMGRASHWASTARWLAARHRAVALDQRGHGQSDKPVQAAYTREAYVEDAEAALEQLGLAPAVLVGHAMGALTAWQLAAKRPDLVRGLVICDMRASALGAASQREWAEWFRSWPVPFATLADVRKWFGEDDPGRSARTPRAARSTPRSCTSRRTAGAPSSSRSRCSTPARHGCTTPTGRSWPRSGAPRWSSAAWTASWAARRRRRWCGCCPGGVRGSDGRGAPGPLRPAGGLAVGCAAVS
ncbi:alpha/beta fold hydrolase [Streptomyces lasalocidi]